MESLTTLLLGGPAIVSKNVKAISPIQKELMALNFIFKAFFPIITGANSYQLNSNLAPANGYFFLPASVHVIFMLTPVRLFSFC